MRSLVIGLALLLVSVSAAQTQQFAIPAPAMTSQMEVHAVEAPSAAMASDLVPATADRAAETVLEPALAEAPAAENTAVEATAAARQVTATSVLAIIGGVVIVVALIALFN